MSSIEAQLLFQVRAFSGLIGLVALTAIAFFYIIYRVYTIMKCNDPVFLFMLVALLASLML
jgi:hypothetical protein